LRVLPEGPFYFMVKNMGGVVKEFAYKAALTTGLAAVNSRGEMKIIVEPKIVKF